MTYLIDLMNKYETLKSEDLNTRTLYVLEMIEEVITYPPVGAFSKTEICRVDDYVKQLVKDLRKEKQYLFSVRISKIWKKRDHLLQLAKTWHEIKNDFMDELEYHEEVKWLRDERKRLVMK